MTDLVLRDIDPGLAGRIRTLAEMQGRSVHEAMAQVLETGVHACEVQLRKQLDLEEEAALKQAIAALEQVPDDAGFGLIGRI
jgi:plasmid stability protein